MIGEKLFNLRNREKLSQQEVGLEVGVAQNTISMFEKDLKDPTIPVLIRMSRFFGCTTDYLLGLSDKEN